MSVLKCQTCIDEGREHDCEEEEREIKAMSLLSEIQQKLSVPKGQRNSFGNYNYRSCEDILNAVKPLLDGAVLTLNDELVSLGDRYYVRATATLTEKGGECVKWMTTAFAREAETKKGMDVAQITGAASSYARKYALSGLFCLDDERDVDTQKPNGGTETTPKHETCQFPSEDEKMGISEVSALLATEFDVVTDDQKVKDLLWKHGKKYPTKETAGKAAAWLRSKGITANDVKKVA